MTNKVLYGGDKLRFVESWQHAHHFSDREKESQSLDTLSFQELSGSDLERVAHAQLDEIWSKLGGYSPEDRVVLMTRSGDHPEVIQILKG